MRRILPAVFKVAVSLGGLAIIYFLFRDQIPQVIKVFHSFRWKFFALAAVLYVAANCIIAVRLRLILAGQKVFMSLKLLIYYTFIGNFFNLFLPSAVGGDVVKAFYVYKKSGEKIPSFTSIFLDRLAGAVAFMGMAFVSLLFFWGQEDLAPVRNSVSIFFACMLVGFAFLLSRRFAKLFKKISFLIPFRRLREFVIRLYGELREYREDKRILLKALGVSVAMQLIFVTVYYFLSLSLRLPVPYFTYFFIVPIVAALSMAPSINGLGVREAGVVYFLSRFAPKESALAVSLLYAVLLYGVGFIFGIYYLIREGFSSRLIDEAASIKEETDKLEASQEIL